MIIKSKDKHGNQIEFNPKGRGARYTVNGLTISYLSRKVGGKQQDTLLQRARFFGYHAKYESYIHTRAHGE